MNLKELKEIIQQVVESDIADFEFERAGTRLRIRRGSREPVPMVMPLVQQPAMAAPPALQIMTSSQIAGNVAPPAVAGEAESPVEVLHTVRSPIVGTFYRAPSPGAKTFVKVGDSVEVGQVLCIIEAMKLMNEIESDMAGEIVKVLAENSQPVEYGQPLFLIRPH
jgi:acetyl-CoA carboxylase biotin carboxyl carrier protein